MVVLINSTLSSEYANSYINIAYADEYFSDHFDTTKTTTWEALGDGQKQSLLVQATLIIEQFKYTYVLERDELTLYYDSLTGLVHDFLNVQYPVRYTWNQNLQFPRNLDVDSVTGLRYIPEAVKIAQCEQSIALKDFTSINLATTSAKILAGIKSEEVELPGPIRKATTYQDSATMTSSSSATLTASVSAQALQYLSPYMLYADRVYRS
jgi:hypothetical protein